MATQKLVSGLSSLSKKNYEAAKKTFQSATQHDKVSDIAGKWAKYVDNEVMRLAELRKEIVINTDVEPVSG